MNGSADLSGPGLRRNLAGPSTEVAPRLLGAVVTHGPVSIRLTEVEAYAGLDDPGSHAYRGPTPRTQVMFGPPGHLYVYFSYGMHWCANVVCGEDGTASAVLLRGGEVVAGLEEARTRRNVVNDRDLARGPARLAQALGLDGTFSGSDLVTGPVRLRLAAAAVRHDEMGTGPRVGLSKAADRPWRFWITGEPTVSPYRAATQRRRRSTGP